MSKRLDAADSRAASLVHLLVDVLPSLQRKPDRILIENVKGFAESATRNLVVRSLETCGFAIKELRMSPMQLGLPNQRMRYFLLAKRRPLEFRGEPSELCRSAACLACHLGPTVQSYLDRQASESLGEFLVPRHTILSHGLKFDIVRRDSAKTMCFTKGYSRLVEGAGSVLQQLDGRSDSVTDPSVLLGLGLRFFTPSEILRIHGFPASFAFSPGTTNRSRYRLLGNSLNCVVVSHLLQFLLE
jgi:tRNA (cytosine38-C5)-methyltransferase